MRKKPRWFTYRQKKLIEETLAAAHSLYETYALHDDWDAGEDSDWVKLKLQQSSSYLRALRIFMKKTDHIKKFKRRRKRRLDPNPKTF